MPVLSQREKATLGSVALGLAAVAVRVGTRVLRHVVEERREKEKEPSVKAELAPPAPAPGIVVRRRWVVGNSFGPLRWGEEEIEIDDRRGATGDPGSYQITFK
jgi:hypothetical protein